MNISAGEFKARCLKLMEDVRSRREEIVITKYGKPVAKLVPIDEKDLPKPFGFMKGTVVIKEDIVRPIGERWEADD